MLDLLIINLILIIINYIYEKKTLQTIIYEMDEFCQKSAHFEARISESIN